MAIDEGHPVGVVANEGDVAVASSMSFEGIRSPWNVDFNELGLKGGFSVGKNEFAHGPVGEHWQHIAVFYVKYDGNAHAFYWPW